MIAASELRIGNNVYDTENNIVFVDGIDFYGNILKNCEDCDDGFEKFEPFPIPITPEILAKCGFEKKEKVVANRKTNSTYYNNYWFNDFNIEFKDDYLIIGIVSFYENCPKFTRETFLTNDIKYLHQLQNLYFALIGEELKVNLSEPELST